MRNVHVQPICKQEKDRDAHSPPHLFQELHKEQKNIRTRNKIWRTEQEMQHEQM